MLAGSERDRFGREEIRARRPPRNVVDPWLPYAFFVEPECSATGAIEDVAAIFLTNRECPFTCLMCDLWRNTTTTSVPIGAIPAQIDHALGQLPAVGHVKLYNSGNFFDRQAVHASDWEPIAARVRGMATVIVENHPRLCGPRCLPFRDLLEGELEIALGLETIHPEALAAINKQMTVADFDAAADFLVENAIAVRAFILLSPPFLDETEAVDWAIRSVDHAFARGARACSIIPVRGGNGIMDDLTRRGLFAPPALDALERTVAAGLALGRGRVFADLWEVERLASCPDCGPARRNRLREMNLAQRLLPRIPCRCGGSAE